jgi:enterochelin esterase-like enzyme
MLTSATGNVSIEHNIIPSIYLKRDVIFDCYLPPGWRVENGMSLLLINDGQDLVTMQFQKILDRLYQEQVIDPLLCVGIHCCADRKNEYGTANNSDYKGRGAKAASYNQFVMKELLPIINKKYEGAFIKERAYAGFSLGGLSALDIGWNNPSVFTKVGVFSGSFWWRDKAQEDTDFDEDIHRIMHRLIRQGKYHPQKFFFQVGTLDETADRNNNGIIDAIDDTITLIQELKKIGYTDDDIKYIELKDGKHDVATWARGFPEFLKWGWRKNQQ